MTTTAEIKERPILFSGEMVRAILKRQKTQTRRVIKPQPLPETDAMRDIPQENRWWAAHASYNDLWGCAYRPLGSDRQHDWKCPYGRPGDRLWVRETWAHTNDYDGQKLMDGRKALYRADCDGIEPIRWRPSIHMPRWASRLLLDVTDVRVERLQEITEGDAIAEGVNGGCLTCGNPQPCGCAHPKPSHRDSFVWLWDKINGKRGFGWNTNPHVWVVEFKRASY